MESRKPIKIFLSGWGFTKLEVYDDKIEMVTGGMIRKTVPLSHVASVSYNRFANRMEIETTGGGKLRTSGFVTWFIAGQEAKDLIESLIFKK